MNRICFISVAVLIAAVATTFIVLCVWLAYTVNGGKTLDPRAPPADVEAGVFSHQTRRVETWSKHPVDGGTVAARTATAGGTEASSFKLFDYAPSPPPCGGSCRAPAPPARATDPRATPPAPAFIGERAPFWYEREGVYEAPDYPEPEAEREGLFSRLRARRNR